MMTDPEGGHRIYLYYSCVQDTFNFCNFYYSWLLFSFLKMRFRQHFNMLLQSIFLVCLCAKYARGEVFDYYTSQVASADLLSVYEQNGLTSTCTIDVAPCDENEWKRIDGSCNNLNNPARGTYFVPLYRLLPAHFHDGYKPRLSVSGKELTSARKVRLHLLKAGKSSHKLFNQNLSGYGIFLFNDIGSVHDIDNMLRNTTNCCEAAHMDDSGCTPNKLTDDDPVHRFSNIRCFNSTRALYYQDFQCTTDPVPAPIAKATAVYDLSHIYNAANKGDAVIRSYEGGKLSVEKEDGKDFPPSGPTGYCPNNQEDETRCFENFSNSLLPVMLFITWFVRHHNYLAEQLAVVNPCWDDDTLFYVARDLNIAASQQLYLYEWLSSVVGYENLLKAGVITEDGGFRDIYDDSKYPEVTMEYTFVLRWFHLIQESIAKLHDKDGNFIKDYPLFNITFRTGFLAKDNNMEYLTQSTFRTPCHGSDFSVDYEIADHGLPGVQIALDVGAGDLNKGRHFGMAPYIDYLKLFFNKTISRFEDLIDFMTEDKIDLLREVYEDVRDIDLMAGLWVEEYMEGGEVPPTLASILTDNAMRAITGDRHWYERPNRPHAFTEDQLKEVRKFNLARLLCNVGDKVVKVPTKAFLNISPDNPLVKCSEIPEFDFNAWADSKCNSASSEIY